MHFKICLFTICALLLRTASSQPSTASTVHGETANPARRLQPRHYNPHPFASQHEDSGDTDVVVINDNGHGVARRPTKTATHTSSSHVKRRQSPALYNQGPIQFPSNNDVTADTSNGVNNPQHRQQQQQQQQQLQNNRRLYLSGRPASTAAGPLAGSAAASDYDDYDQQLVGSALYNKKHYAFSYVVRDHESGDDFSHQQQQQRDGAVKGSYKVQLPDGRTQVVKYTADDSGYKADVSYIEDNHLLANPTVPTTHQQQLQHSVSPSPHLIAAEPIYKYYKHLQDNQLQPQPPQQHQHQQMLYRQPSPGALSYDRLSGGYTIPAPQPTQPTAFVRQHPAHLVATPSAAAYHHQPHALVPSPTPSAATYIRHQQQPQQQQYVQNVQIDTYNTAPHLLRPNTGRIVFPTAPTPYQDIHVLPSPRTHPSYASPTPFAASHRLSPKNTNIVSSPATLVASGDHRDVNYNYRDYDYGQHQQHQQQVAYQQQRQQPPALFFVASEAPKVHDPRGGAGAAGVLLQPNQALYYKQSR